MFISSIWNRYESANSNPDRSLNMFDQQYPHLASWILSGDGWIELGQDDFSYSLVRVLDSGGMIWESDQRFKTVDQALAATEQALAEWH